MTAQQIQSVKESWGMVAQLEPVVVGGLFYNRLFEMDPALKPLFRNSMPEQSRKLIAMIGYVIHKLDSMHEIRNEVEKLGRRHIQYGVKHEHYSVVGKALLWTLQKGLGKYWTEELKTAWSLCYGLLSAAMMQAQSPEDSAA